MVPEMIRGRIRSARRALAERRGSDQYSKPALFGIDDALQSILPRRPGVFVEVGANDGYQQSNTYYLERCHGWTGILIEPIPTLYRRCRRRRRHSKTFNCALVPNGFPADEITLYDMDLMSIVADVDKRFAETHLSHARGLMGRAPRTRQVPARTLSSILDEARCEQVDFMSIDVEGYELEVLKGLDLARHCPKWILIEVLDQARRVHVDSYLAETHTPIGMLSPHDILFERVV